MRRGFAPSVRLGLRIAGNWLAALALVVQLAAASVVAMPSAPAASLDGLIAASLCTGADDAGGGAPAHDHHAPDCALCPLCHAIAHAGVLLAPPAFAFATPLSERQRPGLPPPPRAPPVRAAGAAYPRGPPFLI
jgi:hypothetical protein